MDIVVISAKTQLILKGILLDHIVVKYRQNFRRWGLGTLTVLSDRFLQLSALLSSEHWLYLNQKGKGAVLYSQTHPYGWQSKGKERALLASTIWQMPERSLVLLEGTIRAEGWPGFT